MFTDKSLPKDKILRRWREVQSRARFEAARAAIITSLRIKFSQQTNANVTITGDNTETETETSNGNRDSATQTILKLVSMGVRLSLGLWLVDEGSSHARRLRTRSCDGTAEVASSGSRAAGTEGTLRGLKTCR